MLLAVATGALAAAAPGAAQSPDSPAPCETVEQCLALLTDTEGAGRSVSFYQIAERLHALGPAAADAIVPLLAHPSELVRRRASWALEEFEEIDPRHAPALIAAHRRGLDVAKPLARTGSDEALRYLQSAWTTGEDDDKGVRDALPKLGPRAGPFLLSELARCRRACSRREAGQILYALDRIEPLSDEAMAIVREIATAESTEPQLRLEMENALIGRGDPSGLPILVRRLESVRGDQYENWTAAQLLQQIHQYDEAAQGPAGALILHYLRQRDLPVARTAAAVAAWATDYRAAIPVLRAALADADRDWLFAYQAIAALAELRGEEARPEIARLARDHWYRPVRHNARRALSMLDGGTFELAELRGKEERGPYAGKLNFAADVAAVRDCRFDTASRTRRFGRDAPVTIRWPRRGAVRLELETAPEEKLTALGKAPGLPQLGSVTLDWHRAGERIVGIDGDRMGGGLFAADSAGTLRRLVAGNVVAGLVLDGDLLIVVGERFSDTGDLWRLRTGEAVALVDGPLRLPANPTGLALTSDRTLLIRTDRGDVAVGARGRLLPPRPCGARP